MSLNVSNSAAVVKKTQQAFQKTVRGVKDRVQAKLLDEHQSDRSKQPMPGLAEASWTSLQPSRNFHAGRSTFQNSSLSVLAGEYQKQPACQRLGNTNLQPTLTS